MADSDMAGLEPKPGFDYCFWSKLLVAIVLFPLVMFIAASFFASIPLKIIAACASVAALVYAAIKIDRMPCFAAKIPALLGRNAVCRPRQ